MTAPYFIRLLCLCFAAFFWLHLMLAALAAAFSGSAVRRATRMRPSAGANLLLALRLAPAAIAGAVAAGLCAPSYLWFEPEMELERIGGFCVAAALAGAWLCAAGIARGAVAVAGTARRLRMYEAACVGDAPVVMLAGIFRPRLMVSRGVRNLLTAPQLAVALGHERAHGEAHDNLKRLLIRLTPDALPFVRPLSTLERGWARLTEWAADDRAVLGSRKRSLALASALVRVARMGAGPKPGHALITQLLCDPGDLAARVERLLDPRPVAPLRPRVWAVAAVAACAAAAAFQPSALALVHEALEALAHQV